MNNDDFIIEWQEFSQYLLHKNRYFCLLPIVKKISSYVKNNIVSIPTTTDVFRARILRTEGITMNFIAEISLNEWMPNSINRTDNFVDKFCKMFENKFDDNNTKKIKDIKNGFYGYNAVDSSAPPEESVKSHGRANPDFISYLYLSEDAKTAISEIRPNTDDWISVALFRPIKELKIARLYCNRDVECKEPLSENEVLALNLSCVYSSVANKPSDYYATQYVSELIKNLGLDGLVYQSSICKDKLNYVIFNSSNFKCYSSELFKVEKVDYIAPKKFPFDRLDEREDIK